MIGIKLARNQSDSSPVSSARHHTAELVEEPDKNQPWECTEKEGMYVNSGSWISVLEQGFSCKNFFIIAETPCLNKGKTHGIKE